MIRALTKNGKPMRALRALVGSDTYQPMTEYDVYRATRRGDGDTTTWHGPLATLVERGLAQRTGGRGGYRWFITDAGRTLLSAQEPTGGER